MTDQMPKLPATNLSPRSEIKRARMLDEAALAINDLGVGAVDLNVIAKSAGLSRNAMYYYIKDRKELAYLCYSASCVSLKSELADAMQQASTAKQQIEHFIRNTLAPDQPPIAVIGDLEYLGQRQKQEIAAELGGLVDSIACLIEEGIRTRQFRAVDPVISAQCIMGMINWSRVVPRWLGESNDAQSLAKLSDAISDLLFYGFATSPSDDRLDVIDVRLLLEKPFNAFNQDEISRQKISQLLAVTSRLFNRNGIEATSLSNIVDAIGATKGAIYHYFDDKMDLVVQCYERAFDIYSAFIEEGKSSGITGFQQAMIVQHLNCQAQVGQFAPLILQTGFDSLPPGKGEAFIEKTRKIWYDVQGMLELGIRDGSCRPCDVVALSQVSAGTLVWLAKENWGNENAEAIEIADRVCDIIGHGIIAPER